LVGNFSGFFVPEHCVDLSQCLTWAFGLRRVKDETMTEAALSKQFEPRVAALAGLAVCGVYLICFWLAFPLLGMKLDNQLLHFDADSNVRLVQIRAFLAGQGWFDLEMRRYGLDGGTPMHWTRVADLLPSGLILLLSVVFPRAQAEHITLVLAPGLLLMPYVWSLIWVTKRLAREATTSALVLALFAVGMQFPTHLRAFGPGVLDHHNLQLIAILVMLGGMAGPRSVKSGLISACGLVGGLVVGLDSIPILLGTLGALGLLWVFDARRERDFIFGLGLGIVALTPILGLVFIPRPDLGQWCDSWTMPLSSVIFGFGVFLLGVSWLTCRIDNRWMRTGVAACGGAVWLGLLLWLNPACLTPLPVPTDNVLVDRYWWSYIGEIHSIGQDFLNRPSLAAPHVLGLVVAVACARSVLKRPETLAAVAPYAGAYVGALIFAALHLRGAQLFNALMLPPLAILVVGLLGVLKAKRPLVKAIGVLFPALVINAATFGLTGVAGLVFQAKLTQAQAAEVASPVLEGGIKPHASVGPYANIDPDARITNCMGEAQLAAVNRLKPGRALTEFGSNEFWLAKTEHHTVFGGYHRNVADNIEILTLLTASDADAHAKLTARRIDYLSFCVTDGQFELLANDHPDSFIGHVLTGRRPPWLEPLIPLRHGMVFKVVADGSADASQAGAGN
jgi:hypothetical protein